MRVRQATGSDMERIMEIEENAFIPYIRETYQTFDSRMKTFPEGFLSLEDDKGTDKTGGKVLYISSYALISGLRGKGLGRLFFRECLKQVRKAAPQIAEIVLIVSQEWGAAHHIYEDLGFKTIRQIPGFFPSDIIPGGADGIVMIKTVEDL